MRSKHTALALLLAVVVTIIPNTTLSTAETTAQQSISIHGSIEGLGWLHTSGNQIQTASGTQFIFKGAAIGTTNWGWSQLNTYTNGNWNENLITYLKASGGNSIRLTLTWYQYNPTYFAIIDQVVNWCTAQNVYVILDFHYGDPNMGSVADQDALKIMQNPNASLNTLLTPSSSSKQWFGDYPDISWIGLLQFYAARYVNNPTVSMINILNEPCANQLSDSILFSIWRNAATQAVDAIHAVNSNVLVAVYGMAWGNSLVDWYANPLPQNNVVYAAEGAYMAYQVGYNSYADAYIAGNYALGKQKWLTYLSQNDILPMSIRYPVMVMEWGSMQWIGYNATLEPAYIQFTSDALQVFAQNGLGSEYWTWDINSIGGDYLGHNLASYNQGLLDYQNWMNNVLVLNARGELWQQYCQST